MEIKTEKQLDEWMRNNCYNDSYGIGGRNILEGCGLDKFGSLYTWYYTERGNRENLKYFSTEQEAVEYAFDVITKDKFAKSHLVGFTKDKKKAQGLISEIEKRGLEYWKDEIPYGGINDPRTRIFVLGCDIQKALDLKEKYVEKNYWA